MRLKSISDSDKVPSDLTLDAGAFFFGRRIGFRLPELFLLDPSVLFSGSFSLSSFLAWLSEYSKSLRLPDSAESSKRRRLASSSSSRIRAWRLSSIFLFLSAAKRFFSSSLIPGLVTCSSSSSEISDVSDCSTLSPLLTDLSSL